MKSTGVVRNIDELGRICLPKELRRTLNIENGDALEIFTDGDCIVLRKYAPGCTFCGSLNIKLTHSNKPICHVCAVQIATDNTTSDITRTKQLEG